MAKPIIDVQNLEGKAAEAFLADINKPRDSSDVQKRIEQARKTRNQMKPRRENV